MLCRYVESGKAFLKSWAEGEAGETGSTDVSGDDPEDRATFSAALDAIDSKTPIALRLLTAYKCDHQGKAFTTADGLRSAFKSYFARYVTPPLPLMHYGYTFIWQCRVHGCQGEIWKSNSATQEWDGNPVFDPEYKTYYESLKNRNKRTGTSTQALPMLPKDLKVVMQYLDGEEAIGELGETKWLYFKAFATTTFSLWTW